MPGQGIRTLPGEWSVLRDKVDEHKEGRHFRWEGPRQESGPLPFHPLDLSLLAVSLGSSLCWGILEVVLPHFGVAHPMEAGKAVLSTPWGFGHHQGQRKYCFLMW